MQKQSDIFSLSLHGLLYRNMKQVKILIISKIGISYYTDYTLNNSRREIFGIDMHKKRIDNDMNKILYFYSLAKAYTLVN